MNCPLDSSVFEELLGSALEYFKYGPSRSDRK